MISSLIGAFMNGVDMINQSNMLDKQIQYSEDAQRRQNEANMLITQEYNNAQRQLAEYQNQYNTDMWNKHNAYNSPKETMQRLVDAGINPRAYQQIGQFANAGTPQPAAQPELKMREYVEPGLRSMAARLKKIDLYSTFTEQKIRATELTSNFILAKRRLDELKRHNIAMEGEKVEQRMTNEAIALKQLMLQDFKFRLALSKSGITLNDDGTFDIPQGDIRLEEKHQHAIINSLQMAAGKTLTEQEYLEIKKDLEIVNTGSKFLDTILKFIAKLF